MIQTTARFAGVVTALGYLATLTACSSPQATPPASAAGTAGVAHKTAVGALDVRHTGSGYFVTLVNPKDGASVASSSYQKEKQNCNKLGEPCFIFSALNGQEPLPVSAQGCLVATVVNQQVAFCKAQGAGSVTIDAPDGGTIGYDASGPSEMGKNCFPTSLIYQVGGKDVYSVLADDGCHETIRCAAHNVGTVDADSKDVIQGPCYFVQRH